MTNSFILFYVTNATVDGIIDLFDLRLQVVVLEVILYQWSTHTVMGTKIGVNPHGNSRKLKKNYFEIKIDKNLKIRKKEQLRY